MSSDESDLTPEFIRNEANGITNNLLPEKSKEIYMKAYDDFQIWRTTKGIKSVSESVLLVYFQHLSCTKKSSSLWCIYSKLRSTISIKHNIEIHTYRRLLAFLKRKSEGYRAKKSKIFTAEHVETFLNEAPDHSFLATKVALILGVNGACRGIELVNLKIEDISKPSAELLLVNLTDTKTKRERSFIVRGQYVRFVEKYIALRPTTMNNNRFFIAYCKGKCTRQVMGKNKIGAMPKDIANYLKLDNPELYTGHCFRRTSATLLADSGADMSQIKRHGGWKSDTVAEGYIENSIGMKSKISSRIGDKIHLNTQRELTSPQPSTSKQLTFSSIPEQTHDIQTSPTFTIEDNSQQTPASGIYLNNNTQNLTPTSINVPNKNITLSFYNWSNVSNITLNF